MAAPGTGPWIGGTSGRLVGCGAAGCTRDGDRDLASWAAACMRTQQTILETAAGTLADTRADVGRDLETLQARVVARPGQPVGVTDSEARDNVHAAVGR